MHESEMTHIYEYKYYLLSMNLQTEYAQQWYSIYLISDNKSQKAGICIHYKYSAESFSSDARTCVQTQNDQMINRLVNTQKNSLATILIIV